MGRYTCPLCNEPGHTSMDCPSVAREDDVPPPDDPAGLVNAIRAVLDQAGDDDVAALRGIRALLRVTP